MKHTLLACTMLMGATLSAQEVQQVTIGDNMSFGLTYSLPRTGVELTVEAHCTQVKAGEFAQYAEKFLGLKGVAQEDQTQWEVITMNMTPIALADSARTYHVVFSEKGALPTFYLSAENTLLGINKMPELTQKEKPVAAAPVEKLTFKPTDVMTSDMLKAGSKAKQAELVAEEIFAIRESRSELVRGESDNMPKDGKQLQLMLDNLSAQEEALLSLFVGTRTERDQSHTYSYVPNAETQRELLFRFSRELGFVDKDDMAGAPYYISVAVVEDNRLAPADARSAKKLEKGIAHCVPGKVHLRLFNASQTLAEGDIRMAQFGHVEQLPQAQFTDKKRPCAATFQETTGAIRIFDTM